MPPRKPLAARHPCGKIKSVGGEGLAPAAIKRLMEGLAREAQRPELESHVGLLLAEKKLNDRQAAAAFRVARIYGAFDRLHGKRRAAVSPSYMMGRGGMDDLADERMTTEQIEAREKRERNINDAFVALQDEIPVFPRWCRDVLEQLCVDNLAVPDAALDEVRWMLDRLALLFRFPGQKGAKAGPRDGLPDKRPAIVRQPAPAAYETYKTPPAVHVAAPPMHESPRTVPMSRDEWLAEARRRRPNLSDAALLEAWRFETALEDRAAVEREKQE